MCWRVTVLLSLTFGLGWCLSALENQWIKEYNQDFNNDILEGTWYRIALFTLFGNVIGTSECPTFTYSKPNATELARYKEEYLSPDIPYSFDDNPIHHDGGGLRPRGLTIGKKQAKFFIMDPNTQFFRPPFTLWLYQQLRDDLIVFQECNSRGNRIWLMSRNKNPSREDMQTVINGRPDLVRLRRQWFCSI